MLSGGKDWGFVVFVSDGLQEGDESVEKENGQSIGDHVESAECEHSDDVEYQDYSKRYSTGLFVDRRFVFVALVNLSQSCHFYFYSNIELFRLTF